MLTEVMGRGRTRAVYMKFDPCMIYYVYTDQ